MANKIRTAIIILLLIVALGFGVRACQTVNSQQKLIESLQSDLRGTYADLAIEKNEKQSLTDAIDSLSDENTNLNAIIADLQARPEDIRYVVRTETILKAAEPVVVFADLPESYVHYIQKDIPVAEFSSTDGRYEFKTHDLSFRNTLVISEKKTAALLQINSSADEVWHEVPVDIQVINTEKKYPRVDPEVEIGIGITTPSFQPAGILAVPLVHLTPGIDILVPAVGLSNTSSAALYLGSANIGAPLPVVDDLWLSAGPSLDINLQPGVAISIGSKL